MALMEITKLNKNFGGLNVLHDIHLDVSHKEILGLIGPNGAGKTTLFNVITGFHLPASGKVIFIGDDITGMRADQVAHKGIGRTFQASVLFMQATVFENVFTAFHMYYKQPRWKAFLHCPSAREEERTAEQKVMEILEFMGLASVKYEKAMNLPHGHQRILGVCLALATNPRLLLLDEPMTGMNPMEKSIMADLIRQLRNRGITIVIVEHDMKAIMSLCDRIAVLNYGRKIAEGAPEDVSNNITVIEAYLGRA